MSSSERDDTPILITQAAVSYEEQHAARKRKYAIMMAARIPCLVLAMVFINTWWVALGFILLSVPLPWMAVLIANDRPPRKAEQANRYQVEYKAIEAKDHPRQSRQSDQRVIDGG